MPLSRYISAGSNTNVKSGPGNLYGVVAGGANGGTFFAVDSVSIGATPNYVTQLSNSSNITAIGPLGAAAAAWDLHGASFQVGLTVAATSSSPLTVFYD